MDLMPQPFFLINFCFISQPLSYGAVSDEVQNFQWHSYYTPKAFALSPYEYMRIHLQHLKKYINRAVYVKYYVFYYIIILYYVILCMNFQVSYK